MSMWHDGSVPRISRAESKERTRQRLIDVAKRLFVERGYAATSLEQIAAAAEVTKGAIYGHFASKEDLLLSAIEAAPTPAWVTAAAHPDQSVPLPERTRALARSIADSEAMLDRAELAMELEFLAALLRNPAAQERYAAEFAKRLAELAAVDPDEPLPGTSKTAAWAISHALLCGLQIDRCVAPDIVTADVFVRAFELLAGLYPEDT